MGVKFSQLPAMTAPAADDYMAVLDTSDTVLKKMPISHASTASVFGLGSTANYGHMKIVKDQNTNTVTNGEALSPKVAYDIKKQFASTTETSATASYAHAKGEFFMWNGGTSSNPLSLYQATAAISVGQSISGKCGSSSVTQALSELNSKTEYYTVSTGIAVLMKNSKCILKSVGTVQIPASGYAAYSIISLASTNMPQRFRPSEIFECSIVGSSTNHVYLLSIGTDGSITLNTWISAVTVPSYEYIGFSIPYSVPE